MRQHQINSSPAAGPLGRGGRCSGAVSTMGALFIAIGSLFLGIGRVFTDLGFRWTSDASPQVLAAAVRAMQQGRRGAGHMAEWEARLVRVGAPVVTSVLSALALLWILLLLGGGLAWLALHGYGLLLLTGAIAAGVALGWCKAQYNRRLPPQNRSN
jgi:hypothetical protein